MLFIFDTHPIQYRSPVFRALDQKLPIKVFFFQNQFDSKRWWMHERNKIPKQPWGLSLTEGFENETWNLGNLFAFYKKAKYTLKKEKPSAILFYGYFLPENWILLTIARNLKIPCLFIGETFGRKSSSVRQRIKDRLLPPFFKKCAKIISIGKHSTEFYQEYNVPLEKITEAKYAIDLSFFKKTGISKETAKKKVGLEPERFTILFIGRLFFRKRPLDTVTLHKTLSEKFKNQIQTVVVGNGEMEATLQTESQGQDSFHYLGFKNQKEILAYYEAADVLFVPSEYETWGLVVNEAMAMGTPALVTENCGVANDLVLDGETGWVFPSGDLEVAFKKMEMAISDKTKREQVSARAEAKVHAEYTIENFAEKIKGAYLEVTRQDCR